MAEKKTLEQVRDWHRKQAYACGLSQSRQDEGMHHDMMADAIDAAIAKSEQVSDILRRYADEAEQYRWRTGEGLELTTASALADALDALSATSAPQAVDVGSIREVIAQVRYLGRANSEQLEEWGDKLTHAIGDKP